MSGRISDPRKASTLLSRIYGELPGWLWETTDEPLSAGGTAHHRLVCKVERVDARWFFKVRLEGYSILTGNDPNLAELCRIIRLRLRVLSSNISRASDLEPAPHVRAGSKLVYFIQSGDDGPIKIGASMDPQSRLAALQTSNPQRLRLLGTIPGGHPKEKAIHLKLKAHRIQGEWFSPHPVTITEIARRLRLNQ